MFKSDLCANKVKLDYAHLMAVTEGAMVAHHLLMEDYRHRVQDALGNLMRETDSHLRLSYSNSAESNAEYEAAEARRYADAVSLYHHLVNAANRRDVVVVNTPYAAQVAGLEDVIKEEYGEMIENKAPDQAVYICPEGYFRGSHGAYSTHHKPFFVAESELSEMGGFVNCEFCEELCVRVG